MNMGTSRAIRARALLLAAALPAAADGPRMALLDPAEDDLSSRCTPSDGQVTFAKDASALVVRIAPGEAGWPGLGIKPPGAAWDLSAFGHVEARVVNSGGAAIDVSLRVDNDGAWQDNPWNCESVHLVPGATGVVATIFGHQYGLKPGYPLDPSRVTQVLLFTGRAKEPVAFRVESLCAAGPKGEKPPVRPEDVRIRPPAGRILGPGADPLDAAKQVEARDGATARVERDALVVALPAGRTNHEVLVRPAVGRWDLTQATGVRVTLRNTGATKVTPAVQVTSDRHHGSDAVSAAPLAPGGACAVAVSFAPARPWTGSTSEVTRLNAGGERGTGTDFASDKADAVRVAFAHDGAAEVRIESIVAEATPADLPDWLGRRPPVDGDWSVTFRDEFDGDALDRARWNIHTENYWDKRSHFSKDNILVGGGVARLRMEKKTGPENDDPKRKSTPYAVGYLDTWGRWAQRYGYFEARMKLPTAPGLWPAFWMMPDRGPATDPQWKRAGTGDGGMEFDIMEHLTRWGPHRYNIAMHWDGYGKEHKSVGTSNIYVQPDRDGFITSGLLWLPGSAAYYCNGRLVARWDNARISRVPAYPILYMVTGGWDNSPLDDAQLPADFVIDYVRIWQRADLAAPASR